MTFDDSTSHRVSFDAYFDAISKTRLGTLGRVTFPIKVTDKSYTIYVNVDPKGKVFKSFTSESIDGIIKFLEIYFHMEFPEKTMRDTCVKIIDIRKSFEEIQEEHNNELKEEYHLIQFLKSEKPAKIKCKL